MTEPQPVGDAPRRVRVICLTDDGRVLLLRWADPVDGHLIWEPPGGGIEAGETAPHAAQRELLEETGLTIVLGDQRPFLVPRDVVWAGIRRQHLEAFFVVRLSAPLAIDTVLHTEFERSEYRGHRWVESAQLRDLDGRLEPSGLAEIVAKLQALIMTSDR